MDHSKYHILLVDDEEEIRNVYGLILQGMGFRVSAVGRADHAMELMVHDKVDFLISDIKMPGASGFDLLSLSKIYEERVPVALISGHVDSETMRRTGTESIQCFEKPFDFNELVQLIVRTLGTREDASF